MSSAVVQISKTDQSLGKESLLTQATSLEDIIE